MLSNEMDSIGNASAEFPSQSLLALLHPFAYANFRLGFLTCLANRLM